MYDFLKKFSIELAGYCGQVFEANTCGDGQSTYEKWTEKECLDKKEFECVFINEEGTFVSTSSPSTTQFTTRQASYELCFFIIYLFFFTLV